MKTIIIKGEERDIQEIVNSIKNKSKYIKRVFIGTCGNIVDISLCQNEEKGWPFVYHLLNSNYVRFWINTNENKLEAVAYGSKPINKKKEENTDWKYMTSKGYNNIYKPFRKCKIKSLDDAIEKMTSYFDKMWEEVEKY